LSNILDITTGLDIIYLENKKSIANNIPTIINFVIENPLIKESNTHIPPIANVKNPNIENPYI
jgi:hypothetical protein